MARLRRHVSIRIVIELRPVSPEGGADNPAPLEVVTSVAGGTDPLPVAGSHLAYGGLTTLTGHLISATTQPWAEHNRAVRPGGWQLLVEITRSEASLRSATLTVEIETRVTLRGTVGQIDLAQTQGHCKATSPFLGDGSSIVATCLEQMSRDLAGWLQGRAP